MTPSELYGMLRWTNEMRERIDDAIGAFEFKLKALLNREVQP